MQNRNPREDAIVGLCSLFAIALVYPVTMAYLYILVAIHESLLQPAYSWLSGIQLNALLAAPIGVTVLMAWVFWPTSLIIASVAMYQLFRLAYRTVRRYRATTPTTAA